ncbi:hypothetical protein BDV18DRAFT_146187 [Aspergillus unguis]
MDVFTHAPKRNTRIPPILASRSQPDQATITHLTTLSQQRLMMVASEPEPDLRRCLGHHGLLNRAIHEAHVDMKKYMDEMLESETESESEDEDEDEEFLQDYRNRYQGAGFIIGGDEDDEYDDDAAAILFDEEPLVQKKAIPVPVVLPKSVSCVDTNTMPQSKQHTPTKPTTPSPPLKSRIYGAVQDIIPKRTDSQSTNIASRAGSRLASKLSFSFASLSLSSSSSEPNLATEPNSRGRMPPKSKSTSAVPLTIHVVDSASHEDVENTTDRERSRSPEILASVQTQAQAPAQRHTPTKRITERGKQYAQKLGFKVSAAVPVTT